MFDIKSAEDFYQKLLEDFDDYIDHPDSARHAMNCAITAYHMHDWVWVDMLCRDPILRAKMGIGDTKTEFVRWIEQRSVWFLLIQSVANGSKHFIRETVEKTERVSGFGVGGFGIGPYGQSYLALDTGATNEADSTSPRYREFSSLLEVVIRFWRDFLSSTGRYPNLPKGKAELLTS